MRTARSPLRWRLPAAAVATARSLDEEAVDGVGEPRGLRFDAERTEYTFNNRAAGCSIARRPDAAPAALFIPVEEADIVALLRNTSSRICAVPEHTRLVVDSERRNGADPETSTRPLR